MPSPWFQFRFNNHSKTNLANVKVLFSSYAASALSEYYLSRALTLPAFQGAKKNSSGEVVGVLVGLARICVKSNFMSYKTILR